MADLKLKTLTVAHDVKRGASLVGRYTTDPKDSVGNSAVMCVESIIVEPRGVFIRTNTDPARKKTPETIWLPHAACNNGTVDEGPAKADAPKPTAGAVA